MLEFSEKSRKAFGWAARDDSGLLSPFYFSRRETGTKDVVFKVLYCGICHTDYHLAKNEWGVSKYPFIPGHECVGTVIETGVEAKKFKVGDHVGLGYISGSCRSCSSCSGDLENYCRDHRATVDGNGGFSDVMVADEHFLVRIPDALPLAAAAPLLCAGVTVFSPLRHFGLAKPGLNLGVVGLGGLGHVAVKFAKAFGARVTVVSSSSSKRDEAIQRLGAHSFLVSGDQDEMKGAMGTMDGILDTVSAFHDIVSLIGLLKPDGKLIMVGAPAKPLELPIFPLLMGRKLIAGSYIGGMKEMQEMIDFAAEQNIKADIEVVAMDYVNTAMERLVKGDVRYRFVIDIANSLQ